MSQVSAFRTGLFVTGALSFVVIGAAQALYGPALPALARQNGVGIAEAGLLLSAHSAGGLAALVLSSLRGGITARHALGLVAGGAALIAAGAGWGATLAGAALLGAGYALVAAVFNRRILTESGPRGPAMVGLVNAIFGLGAIAGPLVLVMLGGAPGLAFALVAAVAALLLPLARGVAGAAGQDGSPRAALRQPGLLVLGAAGVGFEVALIGLGPAALVARGIGETRAAMLASAFFAAFLIARTGLYWLAPRLRPLTLLACGFALGGAAVLAAAVLPPGAFFVVSGAAAGVLFPAYYVAASAALGTGERTGAVIMASVYVGAVTVPAAMVGAIAGLGAGALFPLLAVHALVAALATLMLARRS